MNIMNKLTLENLKKNKKRTVVTVIGVILSTALICAVAGMCMSFRKSMIDFTIAENGNYHVCYENVPEQELKYIEKNINVETYFYSKNVGTAKLENSQNEEKPYLNIIAMDEGALKNNGFRLVEGRMPENNNEIIVSNTIETNGRVSYKVGETINLEVGTRVSSDGSILTQEDPYSMDDYLKIEVDEHGESDVTVHESDEEKIINTTSKQYTVVGIIERPNSVLEPYTAPGYTVVTKLMDGELNKENVNYNIYIRVKNPKEFSKVHKNICDTLKSDTGNDAQFFLNKQLLEYEGSLSEETMRVIYRLAAIVIGIIIASSVFVIRNSFSISVTEKIKEFGMLSSIGATPKQIRKSVIFEGFIIALIGIPLGIIFGILAVIVLVEVVNLLMSDELVEVGIRFTYAIPISVIILSAVLGWVTIFFSSLIPAIKASKISPIEAIRSNRDIKIKNRKLRTSKLTKKIFGIGGVIASKSLKRSKKKYRTTVISLVVSIVVFISLSSFINYGFASSEVMFKEMDYSIAVYADTQEQADEIINNSLVKEYAQYRTSAFDTKLDTYGTDFAKATLGSQSPDGENLYATLNTTVVFVNREYFSNYLKECHLDTKKANEIAILNDDYMYYDDNNKKSLEQFYNIKSGDSITGVTYNGDSNDEDVTIKITSRAEKDFRGYEGVSSLGGLIFVSEDYYQKDKFEQSNIGLYIVTDNANELEKQLVDLRNKDDKFKSIYVNNIDKMAKQMHRIVLLVSIFLYGFIVVITLIGVTNVFNTITTNMILRSKEFAMLKSIGMTKKEFDKMIRLESIMYGLKSLIIGVPIGTFGAYGIYKVFSNEIDLGFSVPFKPILICVIFIFIIVAITMKYSMRQINKQNIVETIRNDNI